MNDESLHSWMEPEFEARIVSLVLGEASDFEREELERKIAESPEATLFFHRIQNLHGLLKQVEGQSDADEEEWKLSSERRENVLEKLGQPGSAIPVAASKAPAVAVRKPRHPRKARRIGRAVLRYSGPIAASIALLFLLTGLLFTTLPGLQMRSSSPMTQQRGENSEWYFGYSESDERASGDTTLYAATEELPQETATRRSARETVSGRDFDFEVAELNKSPGNGRAGVVPTKPAEQPASPSFTVSGVSTEPARPPATAKPGSSSLGRVSASGGTTGINGGFANGNANGNGTMNGDGVEMFRFAETKSSPTLSFPKAGNDDRVEDLALLDNRVWSGVTAGGKVIDAKIAGNLDQGGMGGGGGGAEVDFESNSLARTRELSRLPESIAEPFGVSDEAKAESPPSKPRPEASPFGSGPEEMSFEQNRRSDERDGESPVAADAFADSAPVDAPAPIAADPFAAPAESPDVAISGELKQAQTRGRMLKEVETAAEEPSPAGAPGRPQAPAPINSPEPAKSVSAIADTEFESRNGEKLQKIELLEDLDKVEQKMAPVSERQLQRENTVEGLGVEGRSSDLRADGLISGLDESAKKMPALRQQTAQAEGSPESTSPAVPAQQNQFAREMPLSERKELSEAHDDYSSALGEDAKKDQGLGSQLAPVDPSEEKSKQLDHFFRKDDLQFFDNTTERSKSLERNAKLSVSSGFVAIPLPEKEAAEEPFSTFSLHVGEASFQLARAALSRSQWPERESIRVEEFVNALDYRDPIPTEQEKVAVALDQARHPFIQQRNLLRISLATAARGRQASVPLRLTLLLDNSGSMERPDRRETVIRAFSLLLDQLQEGDEVTLISFARQPRLLADRVGGSNAKQLVDLVAALPSEGGTNIEAALDLAFQKAREQQVAGAQNRIILLTDGAANLGDAEPERLGAKIESFRNEGIAFDAAGIGAQGLNDEILEALTRKGDGRYYLLDRVEDADDGFARQIAGSLRPAAGNVKVQVEFNPDRVGKYHLLGFEKHLLEKEDFRNDAVDAAEMAAAEAGVALYQVEAKPEGRGDIGYISVRFRNLATGEMVEKRWPILYDPNTPAFEQAAPAIRLAGTACFLGSRLKEDALGQVVDLPLLTTVINELPSRWKRDEKVLQLQQMIRQTRELASE